MRTKLSSIFAALVGLAILPGTAQATIYYVSPPPRGNDERNSGLTESQPFATIRHAEAASKAGDVIEPVPWLAKYEEDVTLTHGGSVYARSPSRFAASSSPPRNALPSATSKSAPRWARACRSARERT